MLALMTGSPDVAIRTRGLRKTYRGGRVVAVDNLDLDIPRGGVHGFLGPNGSGKTTTIRMLLGLIAADSGEIEILGAQVPKELPQVIDQIGAIVEQPRLFPAFTARRNLEILGEAIGAPNERVDSVLDGAGLLGRENEAVQGFSLGMKQRLAIAATLMKDPEVLIFDEPTNGLDPAGIHETRGLIRKLGHEGRTVIVSSHILSEVQQMADTVSIIGRGKVVASGPVREILATGPSAVRLVIREQDEARRLLRAEGYTVAEDLGAAQGITAPVAGLRVWRPGVSVDPSDIARLLGQHDLWPSELGAARDNLEDVFLDLTDATRLGAPASEVLPGARFEESSLDEDNRHEDGGVEK